MTDNQQRAAAIVAAWTTGSKPWSALADFVAAALDEAEARGRAEVATKVEALATELREHVSHADDEAREWEGDPHRVSEWQGKASAYAWAAIRLRELLTEAAS